MNKNIVAVLLVISVVSVFLIGSSITGLVVMDDTVKSVCSSDSACVSPEVCCLFYGQESGVCHSEDMCGTIMEITKVQEEKKIELQNILGEKYNVVNVVADDSLEYDYNQSFMYGSMILLLTFLVLILYIRHHHLTEHKKRKKASKA